MAHSVRMVTARRAFAVLICAITIGSFAADLWFLKFLGAVVAPIALPLLPFSIVGSVLVFRRAGGPIGWLLGTAGALFQLDLLSNAYASATFDGGAAFPRAELAVWFGSFAWIPVIVLITSTMVRFPDGRPPGRAFAMLLWASVAIAAIATIGTALADLPIQVPGLSADSGTQRSVPNPFAVHGPVGDLMQLAASARSLVLLLTIIAPAALVVRFRRSRGVERQQLKWLTYTAAVVFVVLLPLGFLAPRGFAAEAAEALSIIGVGLLPVAIGVAVMRYRLYDIDVIIRRTLIYAALSATLLAAYVGGVALLQTLLAPLTAGSGVAVAISTLAVVALFQPLRRRIQSAVDRRFYRRRYDAVWTLDSFAVRCSDEIDLKALQAELIRTVEQTLQPAYVSLWTRDTH